MKEAFDDVLTCSACAWLMLKYELYVLIHLSWAILMFCVAQLELHAQESNKRHYFLFVLQTLMIFLCFV